MRTKEFIEEVELLGLSVINYDFANVLFIGDTRRHYFSLSNTERYKFEVFNNHLEKLDEETRHKLLDLVVEYAKTPIEEREETKKYYLRLPEFFNDEWAYLNYWVEGNEYFFNDKLLKEVEQTQFTQEEIDKLPNQDFIKTLIKEEV